MLMLLIGLLAAGRARADAHPRVDIYSIQDGPLVIGASRIVWHTHDGTRRSDAVVHVGAMLDQRQQLQLDADGLPVRYRLEATIQGHRTTLEVRREPGGIVETVHQAGHESTTRLASARSVDWLDNNSFDSLQALLDRHHGRFEAGTALPVFVPQARQFGQLEIGSVKIVPAHAAARRRIRRIKAELTVAGHTVPLLLDVDAADGRLLRYRQPRLNITVTWVPGAHPVP